MAMAIVDMIDRITKWADKNICEKVRLKLPDDDHGDESYSDHYELVKPAAFSMYIPASDRLPPGVRSPIPSLCVRVLEGADDLNSNTGKVNIQLCFSAWDTGFHRRDVFMSKKGQPGIYEHPEPGQKEAKYRRNGDGWRDAWNFVDAALREIENAEYIDGIRLVKSEGVKYGPMKEQDAIPDYYPLWFAWVAFTLEYGITRSRSYEHLL